MFPSWYQYVVSHRAQDTSHRSPRLPTCLHLCPQLSDPRLHQERAAVTGPSQLLTGWGSEDSRTARLEGGASATTQSSSSGRHPL